MFSFSMDGPDAAPLAALPSTLFHAALVTGALFATRTVGDLVTKDPVDTTLIWVAPIQTHSVQVSLPGIPVMHSISLPTISVPELPVLDPLTPGTATIDPRTLISTLPGTPGLDPTGSPLASAGTIYQESEVDDPPTLLIGAAPRYPRVMAEAGIDGRVTLTFVIDTLGHVVPGSVKAEASTHPAFVPAAEEATYASSFRPAHRHGAAVAVRVRQGVVFRH
jgi:TonB family protein